MNDFALVHLVTAGSPEQRAVDWRCQPAAACGVARQESKPSKPAHPRSSLSSARSPSCVEHRSEMGTERESPQAKDSVVKFLNPGAFVPTRRRLIF
jgi:hypothetical protein